MSPNAALQATLLTGWIKALERVMPDDGHFDEAVLASAGDLPIVEDPVRGENMTPEERARRAILARVGARSFFQAFAARTMLTRPAEMRQRRRELESAGVAGAELDHARAAERYWASVTQWLEDFEP